MTVDKYQEATKLARDAYRRKYIAVRNEKAARDRAQRRIRQSVGGSVPTAAASHTKAQMSAFAKLESKLRKKRGVPEPVAPAARKKLAKAPSEKPREPLPEECCGNDCRLCVWTVYWQDLQAWEDVQSQEKPRQ